MTAFDLTAAPWIPIRYADGADDESRAQRRDGYDRAGFTALFGRAHEIDSVTLPVPPAVSGLHRILCLIAGRITGLDDPALMADWRAWRNARRQVLAEGRFRPTAIGDYFGRHAARLDLFSLGRPWLQDPRLASQCAKSSGVNKLVMNRASGHNQVWLSHDVDAAPRPVSPAEAAWHLIAWLYYGPAGQITGRTVNGRTEGNTFAGPLRGSISFHPDGRNLFESLIAGIPYLDPGKMPDGPDLAPWEDDDLPDPLAPPPARSGLAGALASRFRHAILLTPSPDGSQVADARITWANRTPPPEALDPFLVYDDPAG